MFQGSFKGVSQKFQGCFKEVSRKFQWCFKDVSRVFPECFKGVSYKLHVAWHSSQLPEQMEGLFNPISQGVMNSTHVRGVVSDTPSLENQ